jgi:exopolysaccharide biosynthesis polyprenyl glycosylphosphotransferase
MSTVKANAADGLGAARHETGLDYLDPAAVGIAPSRGARGRMLLRLLILADLIGLVTALLLSGLVTATSGIAYLLTLPAWLVAARIYGLYTGDKRHTNHSTVDEVAKVFHLVTVGTWIAFLTSWLLSETADAGQLIGFWASAIALIAFNRGVVRTVSRRRAAYIQNAVIVGAGDIGQLIGRKLLQHPEYGINLVGFVDAEPKELRKELHGATLLGAPADLRQIVEQHGVDRVIIAFSNDPHAELLDAIRSLPTRDVQVDIVPRLFEVIGSEFGIHDVEGLPLLGLLSSDVSRGALVAKRCLDAVGATLAIALIAPLFPLIALLIKLDSPGPVFFKQKRLGMGMREFSMLKFRTMRAETDEATHRQYVREIMTTNAAPGANNLYKLDRPDAVTRIGKLLRNLSADELPQLLNVLRGDMSLVGPRPCLPYETEVYEPHHFERFLLPAGLTGLWQVTARARTTLREALDLDVAYVRGWSLGLDLRLLCRTPLSMLRKGETA